MASPSARRTRAQSAWNVPARTSRPPSPTRLMIRSRSSAAARLVKVTARIRHGGDVLDADEVGDPVGQDAGLARAGPGQDEQRALGRRDGARLLRVERRDDLGGARLAPSCLERGRVGGGDGRRRILGATLAGPSRSQSGSSGVAAASSRSAKAVPTGSAAAAMASSSEGSPVRRRREGLTRPL